MSYVAFGANVFVRVEFHARARALGDSEHTARRVNIEVGDKRVQLSVCVCVWFASIRARAFRDIQIYKAIGLNIVRRYGKTIENGA